MRGANFFKPAFIFLVQAAIILLLSGRAFSVEKLDPYSAEFRIIPDSSAVWSDMDVSLDFYIHNDDEGKLVGSKFICSEAIESVIITDGEGKRLPYTIKKYPRKRIIWEYGPSRAGVRRAKISFLIRNAVKRTEKNYMINIDWIKWNRPVLNATVSIILPGEITSDDLVSVFPKEYRIVKTANTSNLFYKFGKLEAKSIKLIVREKKRNKTGSVNRKVKSGKIILKNIRIAPHNSTTDRIVFDLNRAVPFEIIHHPEKNEVEIVWKLPVKVSEKAINNKLSKSRFIKGLYWKKELNKKLSCIVRLKKKNFRIRYGTLPDPPRAYIDASVVEKVKPDRKKNRKKTDHITEKTSEVSHKTEIKRPDLKETVLHPPKTVFPAKTTVKAGHEEAPIEERIAYNKVKKLFKSGEYQSALSAYDEVLRKFPDTVFKEDIFFKTADIYYLMSEENDPKKLLSAIRAYKKAVLHFPESDKSPHATYRIAECYRKRKFFVEAKSQYLYFIKKYPENSLVVDARFWVAECLYQMFKFKDALKEFERFVDDFQAGPHVKEAMFRIADCYYKVNDFDRAEYYYEKVLKKWPDMSVLPMDTLNNMGTTFYYRGKFEKSRDILFLSFNIYPSQNNRERLIRFAGDSYQWEGDMQKALNIYEHLIALFPDSSESMIAAVRMADLGVNVSGLHSADFTFNGFNPYREPEKAYQWVIKNDNIGDLKTEAFYKLGFIQAKEGHYSEAVQFFKRSMYQKQKGPYYEKSVKNIKKILVKMINKASAEKDYFSVVELYRKNEDSFLKTIDDCYFNYNVGLAYLELGFITTAEKYFESILAKTDSSDCKQKSVVSLSRVDLSRGNYEKAEERLSILLFRDQVEPSVKEIAYHLLGDSYFMGKKYREAVGAYSTVLEKDNESFRFALSLYRLGESLGRTGYYYSAVKTLKKLLVMDDKTGRHMDELKGIQEEAGLLIGDFFFKKKNFKAAINAYRSFSESTTNRNKKGWALFKWAEALLKTGELGRASEIFSEVEKEMPYNFLGRFASEKVNEIRWKNSFQPVLKEFM